MQKAHYDIGSLRSVSPFSDFTGLIFRGNLLSFVSWLLQEEKNGKKVFFSYPIVYLLEAVFI